MRKKTQHINFQRRNFLKIAISAKTILDICTLYTVYKNLLNPHLTAAAALEQTASRPLTPT